MNLFAIHSTKYIYFSFWIPYAANERMNLNDSLKIMFGGDKKTPNQIPQQTDWDCDISIIMNYHWIPIHTHTASERDKNILLDAHSAYLFDGRWMGTEREKERDVSNTNVFCQLELQCPGPCLEHTHSHTQILFAATEDPLVIVSRASRVSSEIKCLIKWHDYLLSFICVYISLVSLRFVVLPWLHFYFGIASGWLPQSLLF